MVIRRAIRKTGRGVRWIARKTPTYQIGSKAYHKIRPRKKPNQVARSRRRRR